MNNLPEERKNEHVNNGHAGGSGALSGPTKCDLNMNYGPDRRLLLKAIVNGYNLKAEDLRSYKVGLDHALALAISKGNERTIASCVQTMTRIVGQLIDIAKMDIDIETKPEEEFEIVLEFPA